MVLCQTEATANMNGDCGGSSDDKYLWPTVTVKNRVFTCICASVRIYLAHCTRKYEHKMTQIREYSF